MQIFLSHQIPFQIFMLGNKEPICKYVKRKLTGALFVIVKIGNNQFSADKYLNYQNQIHPKIKYYADIKNYLDLISWLGGGDEIFNDIIVEKTVLNIDVS